MSGHTNVIELNGKLYDATTGKMVHEPHNASAKDRHQPIVIKPSPGTVVDGVVRKPKAHHQPVKRPVTAQHISHPKQSKVVAPKAPRQNPAKHTQAHKPHRAKTLIRKGLTKPVLSTPIQEEPPATTSEAAPSSKRMQRAKAVPKSPHISRFGVSRATHSTHHHQVVKKSAHLHVKPAPAHHVKSPTHSATPPTTSQVLKEQLVTKAIKDARTPEIHKHKASKHRVSKKLGISPRILHFGTGALAALILSGFIAYQNVPNISMRIAASRAGFNASVPGYKPSGFALRGPVEYGPGQVTLNFKSNSDGRNFHITQRISNWNSEALLANFVQANNKSYQTYQDKGRTIYIYDGSNATWVSNGVWYQIEGNSSLNSDQLINLATSI